MDEVIDFLNVVDESPLGVVVTDLKDEDGDRQIIYANRAFEELTGYQEDEIIGRDCRFLQGPKTDEHKTKQISESLDNYEELEVTLENYTRDGELFYNNLNLTPLVYDDEVKGFVGYQQDVTEYVEEYRNRELLLRIVNHDLRNNIGMIQGWTDMLDIPREQEAVRDTIKDRADKMEEILDAVDAYRRLGGEEYVESLNVSNLLESKASEYGSKGIYGDIEAEKVIEPDLSANVGSLLENVYENVLSNVREHSGASNVRIVAVGEEDHIFTAIEDDGKGLSEDIKQLFSEGFRGKSSEGMGLGLFISGRICEEYGIEADVFESDIGGAGFSFTLPVEDSD